MDTAPRERIYFPELDGLRFVAFLFVFIHHAFPERLFPADASGSLYLALLLCRSGGLGVDLFFCLSGFLITTLLLAEKEREGQISIWRFYARRALRIWPLYFAFIALCNVGLASLGFGLGDHTLPYLLFVGNWSCCVVGFPSGPASLLWSVSIEEQFYLAWPPLLARLRRVALPLFAGGMVVVAIVTRAVIASQGWNHPATWCNTLARLDELAIGIALASWPGLQSAALRTSTRILLFVSGLAAWMVGSHLWNVTAKPTMASAVLSYPVFAAGAGCMLLSVMGAGTTGTLSLVRNSVLVFLGRISYGLYVFHELALGGASELVDLLTQRYGFYDRFAVVALGFVLTVTFSVFSFFLLERPFLRLKERFAVVPSRPGG